MSAIPTTKPRKQHAKIDMNPVAAHSVAAHHASLKSVEPKRLGRARAPRLVPIRTHVDQRGQLGVIEDTDLEFAIRRVYYIYGAPAQVTRGVHAHKRLEQLIICMSGRCTITFHNGDREFEFVLDEPGTGVHVPPRIWRSITFDDPATVCRVLASRPYEPDDYIFTFEEFMEFLKN